MNLYSVKHVDIYIKQITNNFINYFPDATQLTIRKYFDRLHHIVPLTKLVKLIIDYYNFPFVQLIKLLNFTPTLVKKYGTYTAVNSQIRRLRTVFYCKPGRCFMTVCNENTACIRPYTAQIQYCIRCRITVIRITTKCGPFSCRISL
jgi:hypothetical protein